MKNLKNFYYPESIAEALEYLRDKSAENRIIAGGTSVAIMENDQVEGLVDITRMGMDYIKEERGYITIGAAAAVQDIVKSKTAQNLANGILCQASSLIGSRPLRNMITLGGNIVQLKIWSDLPVILLALDAQIKAVGDDERVIPAEDFFMDHPNKLLAKDEMVTEVSFPITPEKSGAHYIKMSKTVGDYAAITIAGYLEFEDNVCSIARLSVGAVAPLPVRCKSAEKILQNSKFSYQTIKDAALSAREETKTISNLWGSAEYRSMLVEKLSERVLLSCAEKAGIQIAE